MKYRIIEVIGGFYPQEKQCFLYKWKYIDNLVGQITWHDNKKSHSFVKTYNQAFEAVERRKHYLKYKKFKKIHNL